MIKIIFRIL